MNRHRVLAFLAVAVLAACVVIFTLPGKKHGAPEPNLNLCPLCGQEIEQ
ncbi:MAG: hypothetical protein IAE97_00330 [Chthoniobacterales bacterium]|nr:hypothetical protein [Chthoniobacterales bacterium]